MGHGSDRTARVIGARQETIQTLARSDTYTISPHLRDAIAAFCDAW